MHGIFAVLCLLNCVFFICVCNSFLSIVSQKNSYHFHSNKDNLLVDSTGNNITETTHTLIFLPLDFYHANYKIKIGAFIKFWNSLQNNENEILPGFLQWYRMCNWKNFNWNSDCFLFWLVWFIQCLVLKCVDSWWDNCPDQLLSLPDIKLSLES